MQSSTPSPAHAFAHGPDHVQSLERGLAVIRAFDSDHSALTLSEVAVRAGLARAVARRLLLTLEYLGYVRRQGRQFSLTAHILELGFSFLGSLPVATLARPFMEEVAHEIDDSCSLAVLDGYDIVYVQRVAVRKVMTITLGVGARLPAYCTSMGRMLLAGLEPPALGRWLRGLRPQAHTRFTLTDRTQLRAAVDRARAQAYAYVEQELQEGLCSLAVAVRDGRGATLAALNAGMPFRVGARAHAVKKVLPALRVAAAHIERSLSGRPASVASVRAP
ncbi:MAG TPA: IclR family transcriptional regulator C-terminal domain-containing protein [Steroidobacteraceae bacterium]|jgi:IclR family pca regulon transcriptional regulator|nr:IclR family transcriptional regulator C-terminal domain-containing protein [Steroidobacteraceae bacterium]